MSLNYNYYIGNAIILELNNKEDYNKLEVIIEEKFDSSLRVKNYFNLHNKKEYGKDYMLLLPYSLDMIIDLDEISNKSTESCQFLNLSENLINQLEHNFNLKYANEITYLENLYNYVRDVNIVFGAYILWQ